MIQANATLGKRGQMVIPAPLRRRFGLEEGNLILFAETPEGILIRPAIALPLERYSPRQKAQYLLDNATDRADYLQARRTVQAMGLDPDTIAHNKPHGA